MMDSGLRRMAAFALLLLAAGLLALAVSDPYEGSIVYLLDAQHAVRVLDLLGGLLVGAACALAWIVGLAWQHRNAGPSYYRVYRVADYRKSEWSIGRHR